MRPHFKKIRRVSDFLASKTGRKKGLTQAESTKKFRERRLAGIVFKLKRRGWYIKTVMEAHEDGRHARYFFTPIPKRT